MCSLQAKLIEFAHVEILIRNLMSLKIQICLCLMSAFSAISFVHLRLGKDPLSANSSLFF